MSLSHLTSDQLSQLIVLVKQKEQLQSQLADIDAQLEVLESGVPAPKKRGRKPGRPSNSVGQPQPVKGRKRGKRLRENLLKILQDAGADGITVKELAAKLNVKPGNVFSWFYTTGKKIKGIKKIGEAKYNYSA